MDYTTLRYIGQERYERNLRDDIYAGDLEDVLSMKYGHMEVMHCPEDGYDEKACLKRVISREAPSESMFNSREEAYSFIQNAIDMSTEEITEWMYANKKYMSDRDFYTLALSVNMGDTVGKGYRADMSEYKTPVITMVLERDYDYSCPKGFYLKTAYPDIECREAVKTGRNFTKDDVINGNLYTFKSNFEKAAFLYNKKAGMEAYAMEGDPARDEGQYLVMKKREPDGIYTAYIKENSDWIKYYRRGKENGKNIRIKDPLYIMRQSPTLYRNARQALEQVKTGDFTEKEEEYSQQLIDLKDALLNDLDGGRMGQAVRDFIEIYQKGGRELAVSSMSKEQKQKLSKALSDVVRKKGIEKEKEAQAHEDR